MNAYLSLGGNLGDTPAIFARALEKIDAWPGIRVGKVSSLYRTEPQDFKDQPFFTNQVAELICSSGLEPEALLDQLLNLEKEFGRQRLPGTAKGPRPLDLDLLLFGQEKRQTGALVLPHPGLLCRAFVLVPLAEIASGLALPGGGTPLQALSGLRYTISGKTIYQD